MSKPYREQTPPPVDAPAEGVTPRTAAAQAAGSAPPSPPIALVEPARPEQAAEPFADLFGTIAHDLRSPMSTITASASILSYEGISEEDRIECADYILRSVQQMKELLEQASDVVELEAQRTPMQLDEQALDEIVRAATQTSASRAAEAGVELHGEFEEGLRVAGDAGMLTRAFELLLNACVKDSGAKHVEVRASTMDDVVHVEVIDDGVCVPQADIPRLFDRFWERDRGCRPKIGLAMRALDRIVRQHRGSVVAEAVEEGGMRFVVRLPVARRASYGAPAGAFAAQLRGEG